MRCGRNCCRLGRSPTGGGERSRFRWYFVPAYASSLQRRSWQIARKRGIVCWRRKPAGFLGPQPPILVVGVIAEPHVWIAVGVRAVPVQVIALPANHLLVRRQDVAIDQAIQLTIG